MNGVSGVGQSNSYYFSALSSGKKQPTAAAGASELAQLVKQNAAIDAYEAGEDNLAMAQSAANIADGAMSGMSDYLQRANELSIRMSNGLMSDSDRNAFQDEINQMASGIRDIASNTKYNETYLLRNNNTELRVATDGNGGSQSLNIPNFLQTLKDNSFDTEGISKAFESLSSARSKVGAQTNAMEYAMNVNRKTAEDLTAASSRLGDTEYGSATSALRKNQVMDQYSQMMQRQKLQAQETAAQGWFNNLS